MNKQFIAVGLAVLTFGALPTIALAHTIPSGGVTCGAGTVTITVKDWTGDVRITKAGIEKGEKLPPSANSSVTFKLSDIGGNGSYDISRELPNSETLGDGTGSFTVPCVTATPSPSPSPTPTPSPTPKPTPTSSPTSTPTGGTSPSSTDGTPSPGSQGVLAAGTTAPGLPVSGANPDDPNGAVMVALAIALVSVLAIAGVVKARR